MPCQAQFLLFCLINSSSVEDLKGSAVSCTNIHYSHDIVKKSFDIVYNISVTVKARKLEASMCVMCDNLLWVTFIMIFSWSSATCHSSAKISVLTYSSTAAGRWWDSVSLVKCTNNFVSFITIIVHFLYKIIFSLAIGFSRQYLTSYFQTSKCNWKFQNKDKTRIFSHPSMPESETAIDSILSIKTLATDSYLSTKQRALRAAGSHHSLHSFKCFLWTTMSLHRKVSWSQTSTWGFLSCVWSLAVLKNWGTVQQWQEYLVVSAVDEVYCLGRALASQRFLLFWSNAWKVGFQQLFSAGHEP